MFTLARAWGDRICRCTRWPLRMPSTSTTRASDHACAQTTDVPSTRLLSLPSETLLCWKGELQCASICTKRVLLCQAFLCRCRSLPLQHLLLPKWRSSKRSCHPLSNGWWLKPQETPSSRCLRLWSARWTLHQRSRCGGSSVTILDTIYVLDFHLEAACSWQF